LYDIVPDKDYLIKGDCMQNKKIPFGSIFSSKDIGNLIRTKRKTDKLTQAEAAALCGVGTRFWGELERGKATAQIGKVLRILNGLGLELQITAKGIKR
jgi:y4mF family transcriptional regulator